MAEDESEQRVEYKGVEAACFSDTQINVIEAVFQHVVDMLLQERDGGKTSEDTQPPPTGGPGVTRPGGKPGRGSMERAGTASMGIHGGRGLVYGSSRGTGCPSIP